MVEAPGTAPGSTTIIPRIVYRHSQQADSGYLGRLGCVFKPFRSRRCAQTLAAWWATDHPPDRR